MQRRRARRANPNPTRFFRGLASNLPRRLSDPEIVSQAVRSHTELGGATFHPNFGNLNGLPLWAVSPFPERGRQVEGPSIRPEDLTRFIEANHDLLDDPRHCIGTWYNRDDDITY